MYCCGSEGTSQAWALPGLCWHSATGPWLPAPHPHCWFWVLSIVTAPAVTPFPCSVTSSRDLMRVLMNLCPSFPSIMLLRICGTQRKQLRATEPGHAPVGAHPLGVACEQPGKVRRASTQGTVTQLLSPLWLHGSCVSTLRMRLSAGQAAGAECPLQLQMKGASLCPRSCPWSAHLLLVFILQLSIQEVQRHWLTEIDDLQEERESQGRAQGSCSRC